MKTPRRSGSRRRKCRHCGELYTPDPRNWYHQKYCSKAQCRQASKSASQQRWLRSDKGDGYFQGPENMARVQQWRAAHPGYWKRSGSKGSDALQDDSSSQLVGQEGVMRGLNASALQVVCSMQPALLIGLIASLTGSTLQDEIAETSRRFIVSGRDILGIGPAHNPKGG
jgi:hypothetical protein